jgi:hypothetical protein
MKPGHRNHGKPLIAHKVQRLAGEIVEFDRCDPASLEHSAEILQRWDQVSHRFDSVGLKIAPPDDAFFGEEIDQDQRPVCDGSDPRHYRTLQLEHDCSRPDEFECERGKLHCSTSRSVQRFEPYLTLAILT